MNTLTYYCVPNERSTFHYVGRQHIVHLQRDLGLTVQVAPLYFDQETLRRGAGAPTPWAIVHPLFFYRNWNGVEFGEIMAHLGQLHEVIIGVDVADSTRISPRFSDWANHPRLAGIILPSEFSVRSFEDSGVKTPLGCVPHGVERGQPSSRFDHLQRESRPKILCFASKDPHRKGWDLALKLIPQFRDCLFVVKGLRDEGTDRYFAGQPNVALATEWLDPADLASLYVNCDLLISLHRGGAFELNCAEALSFGLPVLATRFGCVTEYLGSEACELVDVGRLEPLYPKPADHCGLGATADLADARRRLRRLLDNLDAVKAAARRAAEPLRSKLSWNRAARGIAEFATRVSALELHAGR